MLLLREWMGISKFTNGHFQDYSVNLSNTFCIPVGVLSKYSLAKSASFKTVWNKSLTKSFLIVFVQLWHSKIIVLSRFNGFQLLDDVRIHNWNIIYPSQFVVSKYSYNFSLGTITS
jgi:hypothetical protein